MARTAPQINTTQIAWVTAGAAGDLQLLETTAPSTVANYGQIYVKASDHLLYYKDASGTESQIATGAAGANTALSNLASVAINAALVPSSAAGLDFGSTAKPWKDIWFAGGSGTPGTNQFKITGTSTSGVRTITFPDASITVARTDAAQTFTGIQTITNITLTEQGQIKHTVPTTDLKANGPTIGDFNSGYSSSAIGDLVYLDSSSTWQLCDANTLALYNGLLGIALEVKASGNALLVALPGSFIYSTSGFPTFTVGAPLYMSETPGQITGTAPTTTDSATRVVGWGVHADKMFFFPSPDYITHT